MGWLYRRRSPESMRRLYDWLHRYYGSVERLWSPDMDGAVQAKIVTLGGTADMTALDYACGSGMWTLRIAPHFRAVIGRDQSSGMLARARRRARQAGLAVTFREGSLLEIDEERDSVDWVFVTDFAPIATQIGASSFEESTVADCMVLTFGKGPTR